MTTTPNLPPLPEKSEFTSLWEYTEGQMQAYALAAYQAGRKVATVESVPVLAAAMALLVAGGFVTEAKVDEAIQIALHSQGEKDISANDALKSDVKGGV